jgi:hypothetical protein
VAASGPIGEFLAPEVVVIPEPARRWSRTWPTVSIDTPPLVRHRPRPGPTRRGPSGDEVGAIASYPDSYAVVLFALARLPLDADAVGLGMNARRLPWIAIFGR